MHTYTSAQARANISEVLGTAIYGEPVETTRTDSTSAVVILVRLNLKHTKTQNWMLNSI